MSVESQGFNFYVNLSNFSFVLSVSYKETIAYSKVMKCLPMFSFKSLIVLALKFKSVIHLFKYIM